MDDRGLDLAADPAVRPDRHAAAEVGAKELRLAADRAGPFDPGERLDPDVGTENDRPVGRVEDRVRIDPRGLMDPEPIDRAHQGELGEVAVAHADVSLRCEVALQMVAVLGDEVPGTIDPFAADLQAAVLGRHLLEPRVDAQGLERDGVVGPDPRTGGLAIAKAHPGPEIRRASRSRPAAPSVRWPPPPAPAPANRDR